MIKQLSRFIASFFPRARRPFRWQETWPLAIFMVLFCGICAWLELGHYLMFARPYMLGLILLAPWVWWMFVAGYAGLPKGRGTLSLLMRLCLLGLLVAVLAEPRSVRSRDVM